MHSTEHGDWRELHVRHDPDIVTSTYATCAKDFKSVDAEEADNSHNSKQ